MSKSAKVHRKKRSVPNDPNLDEEVVLGTGRKMVVHPATFVMDIHCQILRAAIAKTPSAAMEEQVARYNFYAPMASCSTGNVPTEAEFLKLTSPDVNKWYEVCLRRNPSMFDLPLSKQEAEKKNS